MGPPVGPPVGGLDPMDKVMRVGIDLNSRFYRNNRLIVEEIKYKKDLLRNEIGLPIVRGKDPHVKDVFYKFLVKHVCHLDEFKIFNENDRVLVERDEELKMKIGEVKGMVGGLLDDKKITKREKFKRYRTFLEEFKERWEE